MKNTSHILIGLSCLIVASAVAYYVLFYLPAKAELAQQKECQAMALNRFEQDKLDTADNFVINQPEFVFDATNNRCLYMTHTVTHQYTDRGYITYDLYDMWNLYTNKKITGYGTESDLSGVLGTKGDKTGFDVIVAEHFTN